MTVASGRTSPFDPILLLGVPLFFVAITACDSGTSPPDPPGAPGGLTATPLSTTSVRLTWSEDSPEIGRIEIERAEGEAPLAPLTTVDAGLGTFEDRDLEPDTRYRYRLRACNEGGCSPFSATAEATTFGLLDVVTDGLPSGVEGKEYAATLEAEGGDGTVTWSMAAGELPSGLDLGSGGAISGIPAETGTFVATVEAQSGDGQSATAELTLTVYGALTVTTEELPSAIVGQAYEAALEATGGDGQNTWQRVEGALPSGLELSEAGVISGVPEAQEEATFTVEVTSGDGQTATAELQITVHEALEVTTAELPDGRVGEAYSEGLEATGGDGSFAWQRVEGALPEGLTLSTEGIISGTPQASGDYAFTVEVTSGDGQSATAELQITVVSSEAPEEVVIQTALLSPALVGGAYDVVLRATGGDGSGITWSLVSGTLPEGLGLDPEGSIQGTPTVHDTVSITLQAASGDDEDQATYDLIVVENDPDTYDLTAVNVVPVSADIQDHVDEALDRWEAVVTGDLVPIATGTEQVPPSACGGFGEGVNGTVIDDIIVLVNISSIDGPGGTLGLAGPCVLRNANLLPAAGILILDEDDLATRVGTQNLTDLIFHEIGHVLGYGPLWSSNFFDLIEGSGTDDPRFTGPVAIDRFEDLGGSGNVPLENDGGSGTAEAHWEEDVFDTEVMTGFSEPIGVEQPLSEVTIGSMEDLGYQVDFGQADPFDLTQPAALAEGDPTADENQERWGYDVLYEGPVYVLPPGSAVRIPGEERQ